MSYQRSIDLAYDRDTGECYDAATSFRVAKEAYELRKRYNAGELKLGCYRCDQPLLISDSKNDHVHFKHFPNADDCPLKDGKMSRRRGAGFYENHPGARKTKTYLFEEPDRGIIKTNIWRRAKFGHC